MQSYPLRVLDRRLQKDWARATKEGPGVLMNLRVEFLSPWAKVGFTLLCKYYNRFFPSFGPCILAILVV